MIACTYEVQNGICASGGLRSTGSWLFLLVILIAFVTYVDRFVLPTAQTPFMPTPTVTRAPESYVTEAEGLFAEGKLLQSIDTYMEAIRLTPNDPALYIALARVQIFAGKYDDALVNAENSLLLNPNSSMALCRARLGADPERRLHNGRRLASKCTAIGSQ